MVYTNGDTYTGLWKANTKNGLGKFTSKLDGIIKYGSWKSDKFIGPLQEVK